MRDFSLDPGGPGHLAFDTAIFEPIMMNVGICMPEEGDLASLLEVSKRHDALQIIDEVNFGAELARGGACEYFGVEPDIVCLAKPIGGDFALSAYGARKAFVTPSKK